MSSAAISYRAGDGYRCRDSDGAPPGCRRRDEPRACTHEGSSDGLQGSIQRTVIDQLVDIQRLGVIGTARADEVFLLVDNAVDQHLSVRRPVRIRREANHVWWSVGGLMMSRHWWVALRNWGRLDVVCNNAGIIDRFVPVGEMTDEVWMSVLAVNLSGPIRLSRAAIPLILQAQRSVIINTSSVAGMAGGRGDTCYTVSKHGLIGLPRNFAATYGRDGIRCEAIAPGAVNICMSFGGEPNQRGYAALRTTLPANMRAAEPREIADLAVTTDVSRPLQRRCRSHPVNTTDVTAEASKAAELTTLVGQTEQPIRACSHCH